MTTTHADLSNEIHKLMSTTFDYRGPFGDDPKVEKVHAVRNPEQLGPGLKRTLIALTHDLESHLHTADFETLVKLGLVREIGSDLNKSVIFHPAAELWLAHNAPVAH